MEAQKRITRVSDNMKTSDVVQTGNEVYYFGDMGRKRKDVELTGKLHPVDR